MSRKWVVVVNDSFNPEASVFHDYDKALSYFDGFSEATIAEITYEQED